MGVFMSDNNQNDFDLDDKIFEHLVLAVKERIQTRLSLTHYLFTLSLGLAYFAWTADLKACSMLFMIAICHQSRFGC